MKADFKSILVRIVSLQAVAFAVVTVLIVLVATLLSKSASVQFENMSVREHGETIAKYLKASPDGSVVLNLPEQLAVFYAKGLGGVAYTVTDDDDRVLLSSQPETIALLKNYRHGKRTVYFQSENKRRSYLGLRISRQVGGRQVWVLITRNIRRPGMMTGDVIAHYVAKSIWLILPGMLLILVIDFFVVRRVLRPVVEASMRVRTIDPVRLDVRLPTRGLPSEVLPLAEAVNTALGRVERGFQAQRDFTADAAHELRTPLSVLRMRIDTLEDRKTAKTLRADVEVMSHVVEQLFAVAELEESAVAEDETADLSHVCRDVIELVAPMALAQGKDIALCGGDDPVVVRGNAAMLFRAVRNLADNAIKYAPADTTVEIGVDPAGAVWVRDNGPGIPKAERELIFRRFWRRNRSQGGGSGLGLAIVARVAELHGGTVCVADNPGGGAVFTIDLSMTGATHCDPTHTDVAIKHHCDSNRHGDKG